MGVVLLASGLGVFALDQLSKQLIARGFADRAQLTFWGVGIRRLTNARGAVVALSRRVALVVWLAVACLLAVVVTVGPALRLPTVLGLGLVIGGSAGNLVDRYVRAGVLDFVALGPWPPFNVADVALVSGAALAYWSVL